jgi:hypothetical protein
MKTIFVSGACRATTVVGDGRGLVNPIHSQQTHNLPNKNFLTNLFTVKQHIQFMKFLNKEIELPDEIQLIKFSFLKIPLLPGENHTVPQRIEIIREQLPKCDIFLFEICSLKNFKRDLYPMRKDIALDECLNEDEKKPYMKDSFDDVYNDICTLCSLVPKESKIILQTHFRMNIITGDNANTIESREIIYNAVKKYCEENPLVRHFDPSLLLKDNKDFILDNAHFQIPKLHNVFYYLYDNFIKE